MVDTSKTPNSLYGLKSLKWSLHLPGQNNGHPALHIIMDILQCTIMDMSKFYLMAKLRGDTRIFGRRWQLYFEMEQLIGMAKEYVPMAGYVWFDIVARHHSYLKGFTRMRHSRNHLNSCWWTRHPPMDNYSASRMLHVVACFIFEWNILYWCFSIGLFPPNHNLITVFAPKDKQISLTWNLKRQIFQNLDFVFYRVERRLFHNVLNNLSNFCRNRWLWAI